MEATYVNRISIRWEFDRWNQGDNWLSFESCFSQIWPGIRVYRAGCDHLKIIFRLNQSFPQINYRGNAYNIQGTVPALSPVETSCNKSATGGNVFIAQYYFAAPGTTNLVKVEFEDRAPLQNTFAQFILHGLH